MALAAAVAAVLVAPTPAGAAAVTSVKTSTESVAVNIVTTSGCKYPTALMKLNVEVVPAVSGEKRELLGRVRLRLDAPNGARAMTCVTVRCPNAAAGGGAGAPSSVQYVSNLVGGAEPRTFVARGLFVFPNAGQAYQCQVHLSGASTVSSMEGTSIAAEYIDDKERYGTLSASEPVRSTTSDVCYHELDDSTAIRVRTSGCSDATNWGNAGSPIKENGDQLVVAGGGGSVRNDVVVRKLQVGDHLTVKSSVYLTTCNSAADKCGSVPRGNVTMKQVISTHAYGCYITLAVRSGDDYDFYNGTDYGTVLQAHHHGLVLAQKKVRVTQMRPEQSSTCSVRTKVTAYATTGSAWVHDRHTRVYAVN